MAGTDDSTTDLPRIAIETVPRGRRSETLPMQLPPAHARLVCIGGPDLGRSFAITAEPLTLGRGGTEHGLEAGDVSRHHARIALRDDAIVIEDLGSMNGTFVNTIAITAPTRLHVGARVQLGDSTVFVVTHHDELEARMRQTMKLEAMEQMVGGIAHDFNNALTIVLAAATSLIEQLPSGRAELDETLADLKEAASSAHVLARRLLNFRREAGPAAHDVIALAALVDDTVAMARHVMTAPIDLVVDLTGPLRVRGSRDELQQVLLNLVLNARDAMPSGGRLTIAARVIALSVSEASGQQLAASGDYVEMLVADTGTGMSDATLARVFEPFFTTKPAGRGTGLGLAIAHSVVCRHGGSIQVESRRGRGTTFKILLPAAQ